MPPQLVPDCSYFLSASGTDVLKLISLASVNLTTTPSFSWQADRENWFSPKNLDLNDKLKNASTCKVKLVHRSATTPDQTIQDLGNLLANTSNYTFQLYALGALTTNDWVSGVPTYGSKAYYFEESGTAQTKMRLLFDVNTNDVKKLVKLVWYCPVNTLTGYFNNGEADGTTITLDSKALSQVPTTGYHYKCLV